jgi:FG-GAP-like repeat
MRPGRAPGLALFAFGVCLAAAAEESTVDATCSPTTFLSPRSYFVGSTPVLADFNGDGKLDLAGFGFDNNGTLRVLLGNGDGTFQAPVTQVNVPQAGLVAGNFTSDTKPDLALLQGGQIAVLPGNGNGTFGAGVVSTFATLGVATIFGGADLEPGEKRDLLAGDAAGRVVVLRPVGDGTFSPVVGPILPGGLVSYTVGDFDGDTIPDLAVVQNDGNVAVLLGAGAGSFGEPSLFLAGNSPSGIAAGDIDGDGHVDLAIGVAGAVAVLLGNGDGSFQAALDYDAASTPNLVMIADFNGDGKPDIATSSSQGVGVTVLMADPLAGGFGGPTVFVTTGQGFSGPSLLAAADLDGDGTLDLLFGGADFRVRILRGDGTGKFNAPMLSAGLDRLLVTGDFDGDGVRDAIVNPSPFGFGNEFQFLHGVGDGSFRPGGIGTNNGGVAAFFGADVDGDGRLDLLAANGGEIDVLFGAGDGTFSPPVTTPSNGQFVVTLATGDWNGDGQLDVAAVRTTNSGPSSTIDVLLGRGDGTFADPIQTTLSFTPNQIVAVDLDGDGKLDLLVAGGSSFPELNGLTVLMGKGDGTFDPPGPSLDSGAARAAVADLDEDGIPDVAVLDANSFEIAVFFGNGDGSFAAPVHLGLAVQLADLAVGDFNGDGHLDLATVGQGTVNVLLGIGNGHFQSPETYSVPFNVSSISSGRYRPFGGDSLLLGGGTLLLNSRVGGAVLPMPAACAGSAASLRVLAGGFGPVTYQWRHNGSPLSDGGGISGAHTSKLTIASVSAGNAGTYDVAVSDSCSAALTGSAVLAVDSKPATPAISVPASVPPGTPNAVASVLTSAGHTYAWTVEGGTLVSGQGTHQITFQPGQPGTTTTLQVEDVTAGGCSSDPGKAKVLVDYLDVPPSALFHDAVVAITKAAITSGCGAGNYCPAAAVDRAGIAVFILRGEHGGSFNPPAATGTVFSDVSTSTFLAKWIEALGGEGITTGCGAGNYCPAAPVSRDAMAVFLLRGKHGAAFSPPPATGTIFGDVSASTFLAKWIERLEVEGITTGCGAGNYCPTGTVTRGEMAVFVKRTFGL